MEINILLRIPLTLLLLLVFSRSFAGPPLVTDDTGVLDPGGWEVIVAVAGSSRPSVDEGAVPGAEVSYGLYENMQVTGFVARQVLDEDGESSKSGWGQDTIGYKWRF